jgi:hypothetical protein
VRHPRQVGPDGGAGDVLPEPDRERARARGQVGVDVPERDDVGGRVRHLDADGLLAGDRRQDADLRRRERIGEVVLERRHLRDLRPRRELELVAGHTRTGDLAHDGSLDPEVCERLHEQLGDPAVGARLLRPLRATQDGAVGQRVLALRHRAGDVEQARLVVVLPERVRIDEQRRRAFRDDVREVVLGVDRGQRRTRRRQRRLGIPGVDPRGPVEAAADRMVGAAQERACRGAREQQRARGEQEHADERGAGVSDEVGEQPLRPAAGVAAARVAERQQRAGDEQGQAGPERAHVDERAAGDHQPAERSERDRSSVGGPADRCDEGVRDGAADEAPVPLEVEHAAEEEPERGQPEPPELGMVVSSLLARPLLHARRGLRAQLRGTLLARHGREFGAGGRAPARIRRAGAARCPRMWRLALPGMAALVAAVAGAGADYGSSRPDPRAVGPGPLIVRLVADMSAGRYERAWLTLHPAHRRLASRWEYASCERLVPFGEVESVTVLDVMQKTVAVPGVARPAPGAAVTIRIELWRPAGEPRLEVTHTAHVVRTPTGWAWMLPAEGVANYRADRCPADPSA